MDFTVLEICAGGGGQALGLERAGFEPVATLDDDTHACNTLRLNRPGWNVLEDDIRSLNGGDFRGIDLLAGGVPCPPFSIAGKQLGSEDDRDLFPEVIRLVREARPRAIMLENVKALASERFSEYLGNVIRRLGRLGYEMEWRVLNASWYGVPQLRPRFVLVALSDRHSENFFWPEPSGSPPTVGETLKDLMGSNGWKGTRAWVRRAAGIAPTLVGGSKKHGGPDLGPTRARREWAKFGVDGIGIADAAPASGFAQDGMPRLTLGMVARIQGFPDDWQFAGGKTAAYRQIGNAFPPPVAFAVARAIRNAFTGNGQGVRQGKLESIINRV